MKCLLGSELKQAQRLLDNILADERLEFLTTNEDRDFVSNCQKCRHIHWPTLWLERLEEIHEKLSYDE